MSTANILKTVTGQLTDLQLRVPSDLKGNKYFQL